MSIVDEITNDVNAAAIKAAKAAMFDTETSSPAEVTALFMKLAEINEKRRASIIALEAIRNQYR
jgi:acyl-CoA reductase-like NAD-dependent aldehyde dehydrogenase